jgi:conjugative transposon TraK protein
MFQKFKNIDDSFKQVRMLSLLAIIGAAAVSGWAIYLGFAHAARAQEQIYVLVNGEAFQANSADQRENGRIEAQDQVTRFHELVFNLDPDAKKIETDMRRSFYMADGTAKKFYDNLKESGYIAGIVSGNISQSIRIDSIRLEPGTYPYAFSFRLWATEELIRISSITTRTLETDGLLRPVQRSLDNSHGLLIERFEVLENKDIHVVNR